MADKRSGYRWRDSDSGRYLKERDAQRRDPRTVERERVKQPPKKKG
jgi:hypothetical protein